MSDPTRVKLCGMVRAEDVRAAVDAGADYLGFILADGSPRTLTPAALVALLRDLDTGMAQRVAVVRDQPAAWINEVVQACGIDLVQLHGHEPRDFAAALSVPALRVRHLTPALQAALPPNPAAAARLDPNAHWTAAVPLPPNTFAVVLDAAADDAGSPGGGRGVRADAAALRAALAALPVGARAFVAGGYTPANVAAMVRKVRPWGVDVSSGVESAPGVKDATKMREFVHAAKHAG